MAFAKRSLRFSHSISHIPPNDVVAYFSESVKIRGVLLNQSYRSRFQRQSNGAFQALKPYGPPA